MTATYVNDLAELNAVFDAADDAIDATQPDNALVDLLLRRIFELRRAILAADPTLNIVVENDRFVAIRAA